VTPGQGLGRAIVIRRAVVGMTRGDLAVAAGVSYPYLAEIEHGVKEPTLAKLRQIAAALGLSAARLLRGGERICAGEDVTTF